MKIKCRASDDEIFTEDVVQINITPTGYDDGCDLVLFDKPKFVEVDDFYIGQKRFLYQCYCRNSTSSQPFRFLWE